jgi:hypothetical protein
MVGGVLVGEDDGMALGPSDGTGTSSVGMALGSTVGTVIDGMTLGAGEGATVGSKTALIARIVARQTVNR